MNLKNQKNLIYLHFTQNSNMINTVIITEIETFYIKNWLYIYTFYMNFKYDKITVLILKIINYIVYIYIVMYQEY